MPLLTGPSADKCGYIILTTEFTMSNSKASPAMLKAWRAARLTRTPTRQTTFFSVKKKKRLILNQIFEHETTHCSTVAKNQSRCLGKCIMPCNAGRYIEFLLYIRDGFARDVKLSKIVYIAIIFIRPI